MTQKRQKTVKSCVFEVKEVGEEIVTVFWELVSMSTASLNYSNRRERMRELANDG